MGLTPDVAPGTIVQSAWGNEIRDRTVQQFATVVERDTWTAPPTGAVCITLDTGTIWVRGPASWRPVPARGRAVTTTNASGQITITHGMGVAPTVALATPGSATVILISDTLTATTFRVTAMTAPGNPAANTSLSVNWACYP